MIILRLKIEICSYLEKPPVGAGDPHRSLGDKRKELRTDHGLRRPSDTADNWARYSKRLRQRRTANCLGWLDSVHGAKPSRSTATENMYDDDALVSYFP